MIDDITLSWLAGLLEGEGSFMMSRNTVKGKIYHYPKIVVSMTDEDVIQRAADAFGTSVYTVPKIENRKQQWRATLTGSKAAEMMTLLIPHMGKRRAAKIKEILSEYGDIEPTNVRRSRSCSIAAKARWAEHGTREGKLSGRI
jgi:hypothetical protein